MLSIALGHISKWSIHALQLPQMLDVAITLPDDVSVSRAARHARQLSVPRSEVPQPPSIINRERKLTDNRLPCGHR
jgi:hypothetical protein